MTLLYKLTDANGRTRGATPWGTGVTHRDPDVHELRHDLLIYAYMHPLLAAMFHPHHEDLDNPVLWVSEGDVAFSDHGCRVWCRSLTTLQKIPLPIVTTEQHVRFGILCARQVYTEPAWGRWSDLWLSGADRSQESAHDANLNSRWFGAACAAAAAVFTNPNLAAGAAGSAADAAAMYRDPLNLIALAQKACS